jgi:NAD(P)-dependent dehydrogenase (short-subunit alcohol dehydrogenase family)
VSRPVAFITGAAHGQGRAVALALVDEGYDVAALDVAKQLEHPGYELGSREELDTLRAEVEARGGACETIVADVRDYAAVEAGVAATVERFGRIDVLFNNAGVCFYAPVDEMTEDQWDAMVDINLKGCWIVARHVIPVMKAAGRGVIVNNSSIAGLRGMNRLSHYAASKFGLTGLTKSWAIELAPFGIRVVSIHPTGVDTPLNDGLAAMEGKTPQEIAEQSAGNLLPVPWVEVSDVADMVVWLASEKARYVTGAQFVLDAGLLTA